jgi:hypothetical protein
MRWAESIVWLSSAAISVTTFMSDPGGTGVSMIGIWLSASGRPDSRSTTR